MGTTKREREEVIAAIKGSDGIIRVIADRLGVTRQTVYNYLDRWTTAQTALEEEIENPLDVAESVVITNIKIAARNQKASNYTQIADSADAKWYLSRKGRNRGYVERQELTGKDGDALRIEYVNDWRNAND